MYKYFLGKCGFFSELLNLINGLLWFGSDMVLNSEHWIGTYEKGLQDYLDIEEFFKGDPATPAEHTIEVGRMSPAQFGRLVEARCRVTDGSKFFNDKIQFLRRFWRPHAWIRERVAQIEEHLGMKGPYMSVHIRYGDNENVYVPLEKYADAINSICTIENVYLMTDDDSVYARLTPLCPSKKLYAFKKELRGWVEGNFYDLAKEEKKRQIVDLICDVEISRKSAVHIGSSSNVSRFIRFVHQNPANYVQLDIPFDPF